MQLYGSDALQSNMACPLIGITRAHTPDLDLTIPSFFSPLSVYAWLQVKVSETNKGWSGQGS